MKINTKTYKLKDINSSLAKTLADQYNLKEDEIEFVRKGIAFDSKSSVDEDTQTSTMYVSTKFTDRDGDIVVPGGVILDDYRKTPVVLWCHDYHAKEVPVGKNLWIKVDSTGLLAKTKYHTRPGTMGEKVYNYLKDGFPLACSIGFAVLEGKSKDEFDTLDFKALGIDPNEAKKASNIFTKTLLYEYSMVPVASNQNSVVLETKSFDLNDDDKEFIYIIDKESQNGEQEAHTEKTQIKEADSGTNSDTQEKEVGDSFFEIEEKEIITKPDTANYIHIEVSKQHGDHTIRTISISDKQGIKAHYCTDCKEITGYLFDTSKWSRAEAEKWVTDHKKEYSDIEVKSFCECDEFSGDDEDCKACGGKRKPKKEVKAPQCQCSECDATCAPEDGKCDMNCPECGASMSMADDSEDNTEQDACKPKKPKKEVNELGYNISDDEIESLVNQFEKMLDGDYIEFEFDVDVNKKYLFEDCMFKVKQPTEEQIKTKDFDIASYPSRPNSEVMEVFCKFLGCKVKNIYETEFLIPWVLTGGYLAAFKDITSKFDYKDTRSFKYGGEVPPSYEVIKINSKIEDDFLTNGVEFYNINGKPIICSFSPSREGIYVNVYTSRTNKQTNKNLISSVHKWVDEKNPLKGEKFSLNKDFFDIDNKDSWDTVILDSNVEKSLKHSESLIKNKDFNGRGILMIGPPGTGKTKSARILMSQCQNQTFIWVSSKDLTNTWYPEEKIALGFNLARKLAPSILLLEDIDGWIENKIIDMMKTELDGLKKNKNVITILTTNNPEKLPMALIDRPGRFHDVLNFDHPSKSTRERMLKEWLNIENEDLINSTEGFSGAYMWELIEFAKSIAEDEEISIEEALIRSLDKINDQKELIRNIKKETKSADDNISGPTLNDIGEAFIEVFEDGLKNKEFIEIEKKEPEELEFDTDKVISIVEKSLDKVLNTKYIDVDYLVNESLMKAKGKMFY